MKGCQACNSEEPMPFTCHYCGGSFCVEHRLPESHGCPRLWMAGPPSRQPAGPRAQIGFRFVPPAAPRLQTITSEVEVKHLIIAWLVLGFAFSLRWMFRAPDIFPIMLGVSLGTVGFGFILHELAHKFMAQRYGLWAEFRMSPWGLMMAIIFALASGGSIIFAAPGATFIASEASFGREEGIARREGGMISLVGPLTNLVLALAFFQTAGLGGLLGAFGAVGYQVNLWLAAFNLLPFGVLDGRKVLRWSFIVWAVITVPLWLLIALQMLL